MSALCQKRTSECARAMSALPPKADIGTGPRITFGAPAPAAWRYSPRSVAPWPDVRRARLYKIAKPPRRTAPRRSASWPFRLAALRKFSAELFHKSVGCDKIGKTPPKINFTFYDDSPSVPRLNFYRAVKVDNPAAQFDVQFIVRNGKLGDVGMLPLVCDGLPAGWLTRHNAPPVKDKYLWMNTGLFAIIRRNPPPRLRCLFNLRPAGKGIPKLIAQIAIFWSIIGGSANTAANKPSKTRLMQPMYVCPRNHSNQSYDGSSSAQV